MQAYRSVDNHRLLKLVLAGDIGRLMAAIQFLELQIGILRDRMSGPIHVTPSERRKLLAATRVLGDHADDFLLVVTSRTRKRWEGKPQDILPRKGNGRGRPLTLAAIELLIIRMASENRQWSKTRIHGELRKLGLGRRVSVSTVGNIMRAHAFDPEPNRGHGTWHEFVSSHADTMWACDFFTKPVWSPRGRRQDHYVLFFKQHWFASGLHRRSDDASQSALGCPASAQLRDVR